jgi:hypothetical protein
VTDNDCVTPAEIEWLRTALSPLLGQQFEILKIPRNILGAFEPSQIGTIVGALMDACIPSLGEILPDDKSLADVGLIKHEGILKDREGYPDYRHASGRRLELKLLYVDPEGLDMKKPSTPREPSARLTQKVTVKNVDPKLDVLLVIAYQLRPNREEPNLVSPTIIDMGLFPMIECIEARDARLEAGGGRWFGDYETPVILSQVGKAKLRAGVAVDIAGYGRKKSEGRDFNEDTNFGKLARIPYPPLQSFLKQYLKNRLALDTAPDDEVETY